MLARHVQHSVSRTGHQIPKGPLTSHVQRRAARMGTHLFRLLLREARHMIRAEGWRVLVCGPFGAACAAERKTAEADRPEIEPCSIFTYYMTLSGSINFSNVNFLFIK